MEDAVKDSLEHDHILVRSSFGQFLLLLDMLLLVVNILIILLGHPKIVYLCVHVINVQLVYFNEYLCVVSVKRTRKRLHGVLLLLTL